LKILKKQNDCNHKKTPPCEWGYYYMMF